MTQEEEGILPAAMMEAIMQRFLDMEVQVEKKNAGSSDSQGKVDRKRRERKRHDYCM